MPKPIIQISRVSNGWIYSRLPYDTSDTGEEIAFSYDEDIDNKDECFATRALLWAIIEELKPFSKHNKFNVVVRIENEKGNIIED